MLTLQPPRRDTYERARLFDPRSFTHHGKANLNVLQRLLDDYSRPGDLVLDPMAGTGSILVGLLTGRRVIAGDIEPHWAGLLADNEKGIHNRSLIAFSTPALVAQWDAVKLPLASGSVHLVITSPPYFDTFSDWDGKPGSIVESRLQNDYGTAYGLHPSQIANRHIYEDYLLAVRLVYAEVWRVLGPGGKLVLIVKDVIRGGRMVPVVADNLSMALASGFTLEDRFDLMVRGSRFTNINRRRGVTAPASESVLVLSRADIGTKKCLALVELPKPDDGPGRVIASKAIKHARAGGYEVWVRAWGESEFYLSSSDPKAFPPGDQNGFQLGHRLKAARRRELAFEMARRIQVKVGLTSADEISFYGSERYGAYICRRLETLGCKVEKPLAGLNNGQRLAWLTRELESK